MTEPANPGTGQAHTRPPVTLTTRDVELLVKRILRTHQDHTRIPAAKFSSYI